MILFQKHIFTVKHAASYDTIDCEGCTYEKKEMRMERIVVGLILGVLTAYFLILAVIDIVRMRQQERLEKMTTGIVTGLVRSYLFRNEMHGEVPQGVLTGWGVAQGEQYWGGMLKLRCMICCLIGIFLLI